MHLYFFVELRRGFFSSCEADFAIAHARCERPLQRIRLPLTEKENCAKLRTSGDKWAWLSIVPKSLFSWSRQRQPASTRIAAHGALRRAL